jgi:hypothetical protein
MPPPGRNANGRSLGGRKQIQSSLQSYTDIIVAQFRRKLKITELQLFCLLAQSVARLGATINWSSYPTDFVDRRQLSRANTTDRE